MIMGLKKYHYVQSTRPCFLHRIFLWVSQTNSIQQWTDQERGGTGREPWGLTGAREGHRAAICHRGGRMSIGSINSQVSPYEPVMEGSTSPETAHLLLPWAHDLSEWPVTSHIKDNPLLSMCLELQRKPVSNLPELAICLVGQRQATLWAEIITSQGLFN